MKGSPVVVWLRGETQTLMIVDEVLAMYGIRDQMDEAAEEPLNFETPWQSPQVPVVGTARQGMAESDTAS